ncbi:unnamed protein product [Owenia fusiformis]|uniref:Uncharacterized protein n=1 Tax=Owenia fusiformis TaxID=6347 RepID=A0A8J1XMY8_OWEFU|nr:unnamed protein product [Owenia fusiformis]
MDFGQNGHAAGASTPQEDDVVSLKQKLLQYKKREQELLDDKMKIESEFGHKRAKFKDIFMQKEDELTKVKAALQESTKLNAELKSQVDILRQEIDDVNTATALSESSKQDEVEGIQRRCQNELASMQIIMKDSINDTNQRLEYEREKWTVDKHQLEAELHELRQKLSQTDGENLLASFAKSIKHIGHKTPSSADTSMTEDENLEQSMKKAQEDAEMLKSVVVPLEEEIKTLKEQLAEANEKIKQPKILTSLDPLSKASVESRESSLLGEDGLDLDEKVKELNTYLEAEKSSRTDLEMYVAVLNTQKQVLQEDNDKLRAELHEVCRLLESEKKEHSDLKMTWQMANDQFLESQRMMMNDMRRMETVLSAEQQRQIAELQKQDDEREAQKKRIADLEEKREKQRIATEQRKAANMHSNNEPVHQLGLKKVASKTSIASTKSEDLMKLSDTELDPSDIMKKSSSGSEYSRHDDFLLDSGVHDTRSLSEVDGMRMSPDKYISVPGLTDAQHRAIADPSPEYEVSQSLLASAKSKMDDIPHLTGRRLVSDKEWEMLQQEVKAAREKLGRPCDMCKNYEAQLQSVQENAQESQSSAQTLNKQLSQEKATLENQKKYQEELENTLQNVAEDAQAQISTLVTKVYESEKFMTELRQQYIQSCTDLQHQLRALTVNRESIQKELSRLQEENDSLVGKTSKHSQQMQSEDINLPNNLEEMQLLLLNYREEIIKAKVAKEHIEENLKSEILFLKDASQAESQERQTMEETLSQEINTLQEELTMLQSVKSELDREVTVRQENEEKLKETDEKFKNYQHKSKNVLTTMQAKLEEHDKIKTKLEADVQFYRNKVSSLQADLDNSEAVQRDFVKLSQSLQIQLEKIRQGENEVRWQHEEDANDCENCHKEFGVSRRKHHCRHCGHIFCNECCSKTCYAGPNRRPTKVCDVCHTILNKDATPYFSTEPPQTPD